MRRRTGFSATAWPPPQRGSGPTPRRPKSTCSTSPPRRRHWPGSWFAAWTAVRSTRQRRARSLAWAAQSAGFGAVEFWWPFDSPVPGDAAVDAFAGAVGDAGVRLVGLNFYAGDL